MKSLWAMSSPKVHFTFNISQTVSVVTIAVYMIRYTITCCIYTRNICYQGLVFCSYGRPLE